MGFIALLGLLISCCMTMLHTAQRRTSLAIEQQAAADGPPRISARFRWPALSLVPSSLLLW